MNCFWQTSPNIHEIIKTRKPAAFVEKSALRNEANVNVFISESPGQLWSQVKQSSKSFMVHKCEHGDLSENLDLIIEECLLPDNRWRVHRDTVNRGSAAIARREIRILRQSVNWNGYLVQCKVELYQCEHEIALEFSLH